MNENKDSLERCIWKSTAENRRTEKAYPECISCDGYNMACKTYVGLKVLAVIPTYDKCKKNGKIY